jgi:hypothetical protein
MPAEDESLCSTPNAEQGPARGVYITTTVTIIHNTQYAIRFSVLASDVVTAFCGKSNDWGLQGQIGTQQYLGVSLVHRAADSDWGSISAGVRTHEH